MEGKGNLIDPTQAYILPHVPPNYRILIPVAEAASYSGDESQEIPTTHSSMESAQQQTSSNVQATASSSQKPTEDSAYNSEHEHSPEQPVGEQAVAPISISAKLAQEQLWKSFNKIGNEMIVTKPGR